MKYYFKMLGINLIRILSGRNVVFLPRSSGSMADSLTHKLLKENWEGYFDHTHLGIDTVSPAQVRKHLPALGWDIYFLETDGVWTYNNDEITASLRECRGNDSRFELFLKEFELGDFLSVVAKKIGSR